MKTPHISYDDPERDDYNEMYSLNRPDDVSIFYHVCRFVGSVLIAACAAVLGISLAIVMVTVKTVEVVWLLGLFSISNIVFLFLAWFKRILK